MVKPVTFEIKVKGNGNLARTGVIHTPHGDISTPAFVVVGTKASVKSLMPEDMTQYIGNQVTLANTYHLFLQPGHEIIKEAGGIHQFANWQMPTMTDSGGFQVFSLGAAFGKGVTKFAQGDVSEVVEQHGLNVYSRKVAEDHGKLCIIDEEGVTFTSHLDGSMHRFTAERSIDIQHAIGADIIIAFDECTSPSADRDYQKEAMDRTHRWAKRSIMAHKQNYEALKKQGIYGVVQGGQFLDLRQESARALSAMDFDGFGIGGSFSKNDLGDSLRVVNEILPEDKPRHLLGIGEPEDIVQGVLMGCDTFDCVAPTRIGRTGTIYVMTGNMITTPCGTFTYPESKKISLRNAQYINDHFQLDPLSTGYVAQKYTKAYLAHLFRAGEILGPHLASIHNLNFIVNFTKNLREQLLNK
ncbi:tRNA guanosine(34) transglycosylase Tgt [Candidatus Kaiserbacteria bacterium CG_4_9_14_0_2_um_filter_41_32]|uniref:tRNA guanosine(34) transglycosylase Tgt n=1 Tax=Candidatus Kaiserbacteria bacterium CG_4_9_14_0_2_um_filter_41_32 TaxID=1974601 RepID=A0A2M8FET9_9BACT|nr:MAG: tRNA guanosine(34) transglycosylase Tgt [Candidatus Kaiserbacteria bacterium CG_4_9_14_0_2_um_filter_41_32]